MSGIFESDWLALREPADRAARNKAVLSEAAERLAGKESAVICDLGAGTGATLRALSPLFPPRQRWRLIDHDAALLRRAWELLAEWADRVVGELVNGKDGLVIEKDGRHIAVEFIEADLMKEVPLGEGVDLVTASALFDLASEGWTRDLVAVLAKEGAPLLAMLDYDGTAELDPPHADDALLRAAFNRHQRGDKGLGPAMGPEATDVLAGLFGDLGWKVTRGASPWILGEGDAALAARLIEGWVGAAAEEGLDLAAWKAARLLPSAIRVGHEDLFAAPL